MNSRLGFRRRNLGTSQNKRAMVDEEFSSVERYQNSYCRSSMKSSMSFHESALYQAALVFDNSSNAKALKYEKNINEEREIASLTKIMTCIVVLKYLESCGEVAQDLQTKVSKEAVQLKGTSAGLEEGDIISLWDLLHGLMLPSGNDAAYCLAETIGQKLQESNKKELISSQKKVEISRLNKNSSIRLRKNPTTKAKQNSMKKQDNITYFIAAMNKKASELNMKSTKYSNPHGLPDKNNYSTAYDQLLLIRHCLENSLFCRLVSTKLYFSSMRSLHSIWTRQIIWENTNRLLYRGFHGIKTGNTNTAGFCLASWYRKDNIDLICIVLGCKSKEERDQQTLRLIKIGINGRD